MTENPILQLVKQFGSKLDAYIKIGNAKLVWDGRAWQCSSRKYHHKEKTHLVTPNDQAAAEAVRNFLKTGKWEVDDYSI